MNVSGIFVLSTLGKLANLFFLVNFTHADVSSSCIVSFNFFRYGETNACDGILLQGMNKKPNSIKLNAIYNQRHRFLIFKVEFNQTALRIVLNVIQTSEYFEVRVCAASYAPLACMLRCVSEMKIVWQSENVFDYISDIVPSKTCDGTAADVVVRVPGVKDH